MPDVKVRICPLNCNLVKTPRWGWQRCTGASLHSVWQLVQTWFLFHKTNQLHQLSARSVSGILIRYTCQVDRGVLTHRDFNTFMNSKGLLLLKPVKQVSTCTLCQQNQNNHIRMAAIFLRHHAQGLKRKGRIAVFQVTGRINIENLTICYHLTPFWLISKWKDNR